MHAFSWNPQSPTELTQRNTCKEGRWAAMRVGKKQHLLWPNASTTSSAAGWSWGPANHPPHPPLTLKLSAPMSPPNGSIQEEKSCLGQSTVMVPMGACKCLPLTSCAAGRWHSRAHTYSQCACHRKTIQPNNQFKSSSLPLGTGHGTYLTIRTQLSLVFQEQNLCAVKRFVFFSISLQAGQYLGCAYEQWWLIIQRGAETQHFPTAAKGLG